MERYVYFFWVHTKLTADNARTNCKQYSARLFDKLFDGGYSAIVFLAQHLQPEFHFLLGISDKQQDGLWLSSDGQKMNDYLANFIETEPNGGSVENNLAVQYRKLASGEYIRGYFDVNNQQMVSRLLQGIIWKTKLVKNVRSTFWLRPKSLSAFIMS